MSTTVTVAVAKPNHRAVKVHIEQKQGAQWMPEQSTPPGIAYFVPKGGAEVFLVCGDRRLVIEEVDHD